MSTNIANRSPYLRTSREFPVDPQALNVELSKSYIDIANIVNARTIGTYGSVPTVTGNTWFTSGSATKRQTLRQIFTFTAAGNITHNINTSNIAGFVSIYGTFTDGTNWYPLPYVDVAAANNQVNVIVTPTVITITAGGGAPPTITSGFVVLEWLSQT